MTVLCDIGGTFARFALADSIAQARKYTAADFESFEAALESFCAQAGVKDKSGLRIATAAYPDKNGAWRFVNRNPWVIDPAALKKQGWSVEIILNDFAAAVWGLQSLNDKTHKILKPGVARADLPQCLTGPGTGLGLGYLVPTPRGPHVQRTHGGHMLAAALTLEQREIITLVEKQKTEGTIPVFENFVSGLGLFNIYKGLAGSKAKLNAPEDMFDHLDDAFVQKSIRLFHEFFGLFAQTAVVTGHAYGGLYLTGGVLDRLVESNRFDFAAFEKFFVLEGVASVKQALAETPVIYVTEPYLALKGLVNAHG